MHMSVMLPIAAALAVIAIGSSSPATAKSMTCTAKQQACSDRCVAKDDGKGVNDALNCMNRTCDHQFRNCIRDAAGGSDRSGTGAKGRNGGRTGPIVRDKRNPRPGRGADVTAPMVQPRPVTRGPASPTNGQTTVRDHRSNRATPGGASPLGTVKSANRR